MASTDGTRGVERRTVLIGAAAASAVALFMIVAMWATRDKPLSNTADAYLAASATEQEDTSTTAPPAPPSPTVATTTTTSSPSTTVARSTTTTSRPSTTTTSSIDPDRLPTLVDGDTGVEVLLLQRMLSIVTGADIAADGSYGPATVTAVENFQRVVSLPVTGEADHETRMILKYIDAGRSSTLPVWPLPTIGDGGANGCQVAVIGDSLMSGAQRLHERRLTEVGCASAVDGVGGRSLAFGWQCRVLQADGRRSLLLLPEPEPGNASCAPSGLELLQMWSEAKALGDVVVLALGTNDATLFSDRRWHEHWGQALALAGGRPLIALTTQARPGSRAAPAQAEYSEALRLWCAPQPTCVLADWGLTPVANDAASYLDSVHLTSAATDARATFIGEVVAALLAGEPIPNPVPLPTPTTTIASTTTTTTTSTTTTTVPTTTTTSTTTSTVPSTTTTTTTTTSTTTSTTSTSTSTSTTSTTSTTIADPPAG